MYIALLCSVKLNYTNILNLIIYNNMYSLVEQIIWYLI